MELALPLRWMRREKGWVVESEHGERGERVPSSGQLGEPSAEVGRAETDNVGLVEDLHSRGWRGEGGDIESRFGKMRKGARGGRWGGVKLTVLQQ